MLKAKVLIAAGLSLLFATVAHADDAALLKQKLLKLNSLKASFHQKVTDINGKVIQQGSGTFALAVPNRFYWHLTAPDESLIVADGKNVWIYNPFAEEVSVVDFDQAINTSPIALLVHRDDKTWAQYRVVATKNCYQITPKATDATVNKVKVCFDGSVLQTLELEDQQGNLSVFDLSAATKIGAADAQLFKFTVPEGVDIDDQRLKVKH